MASLVKTSVVAIVLLAVLPMPPTLAAGAGSNCSVIGGTFQFQRYFPRTKNVEVIGTLTLSKKLAQKIGDLSRYFITKYDSPNERYWSLIPYAKANGIMIYPNQTEQKALGWPVLDEIAYTPKIDIESEETFLQGDHVFGEGSDKPFVHQLIPLGRLAQCATVGYWPQGQ